MCVWACVCAYFLHQLSLHLIYLDGNKFDCAGAIICACVLVTTFPLRSEIVYGHTQLRHCEHIFPTHTHARSGTWSIPNNRSHTRIQRNWNTKNMPFNLITCIKQTAAKDDEEQKESGNTHTAAHGKYWNRSELLPYQLKLNKAISVCMGARARAPYTHYTALIIHQHQNNFPLALDVKSLTWTQSERKPVVSFATDTDAPIKWWVDGSLAKYTLVPLQLVARYFPFSSHKVILAQPLCMLSSWLVPIALHSIDLNLDKSLPTDSKVAGNASVQAENRIKKQKNNNNWTDILYARTHRACAQRKELSKYCNIETLNFISGIIDSFFPSFLS